MKTIPARIVPYGKYEIMEVGRSLFLRADNMAPIRYQTGGAVGQLIVKYLELVEKSTADLPQGISPDDMIAVYQKWRDLVPATIEEARDAAAIVYLFERLFPELKGD